MATIAREEQQDKITSRPLFDAKDFYQNEIYPPGRSAPLPERRKKKAAKSPLDICNSDADRTTIAEISSSKSRQKTAIAREE
jgi:hypothetical protein